MKNRRSIPVDGGLARLGRAAKEVTQYWHSGGPKRHRQIDRAKLIDDARNLRRLGGQQTGFVPGMNRRKNAKKDRKVPTGGGSPGAKTLRGEPILICMCPQPANSQLAINQLSRPGIVGSQAIIDSCCDKSS